MHLLTAEGRDRLCTSTRECSGNVFALERPLRGCGISKAFPHYLDESCLQRIGAEIILFSMLLSILLRITPSVQASECKWLYQFLKYKLKKKKYNAPDIKNPMQAPSPAQLLSEFYYWKYRIISKACSKFLKKIPIISSFTSLCMKTILLAFYLNISRYCTKYFVDINVLTAYYTELIKIWIR